MKILHTADWHLGTFRSPIKDGVNLRTEDTKKCLDELIKVAQEEKPDYALISGDVFHVGRPAADRCCEEIVTATHYIRELTAVSKQVVVMRGTPNHDGIGQFNVLNEIFYGFQNVHIITTPQVLSFEDVDIAVLPGFDNGIYRTKSPRLSKEEENTAITNELANIVLGLRTQCSPDKKAVLMSHFTVPGSNTESGQVMMLTQFEPILTMECLCAVDFDLVALGHIHRPQQVPNINYCFYSGAINAMNFNDEGQERGFWLHESDTENIWTSKFCKTPIREFITLDFTQTDVNAIIFGNIDEVAMNHWRWNGAVADKIVRIQYRCTDEDLKAYKSSEAILERTLLEDGAFMLWENLREKSDDICNKTNLSGSNDPEENLKKYLNEKQFPPDDMQELILKARPIISQAQAKTSMAAHTGVFEPIEIYVKNYRNYEEETFNFSDISFCTINGQNGAGKSSLFMDAIVDCLYEKPREGELSGWVRNDENGNKGVIMFTFRIGEKTYRITRTRARPKLTSKTKTGEGKLNLAELVGGEWENRSKERYEDTQKEVLDIIGMDIFTFKSCALIMQDQYGLFLQAKPEERMESLGTILGLSIYQAMEKIAADKAKVSGAKADELQTKIDIHNSNIAGYGNPESDLESCKIELAEYESRLKAKIEERDKNKLLLTYQQEAAERRKKLIDTIKALEAKKVAAEQNRCAQKTIIDNSAVILDARAEIEAKAAEYNALLEKEKVLAGESALYETKQAEAEGLKKQQDEEQELINNMEREAEQKRKEQEMLQSTEQDAVIKEKAAEYDCQKKLLDEAYEKERLYRIVDQKLTQEKYTLQQIKTQYESEINSLKLSEESLKKKAELLSNVECVDITNARCAFLADAISAKKLLADYPALYKEKENIYVEKSSPVKEEIATLEDQIAKMEFDANVVAAISKKAAELKPYVLKLEELIQRESRIAIVKAKLDNLQLNIAEAQKRLAAVKLKVAEAEKERDKYAQSFGEHIRIKNEMLLLKPWLEQERMLPVAEERKTTAMARYLELGEEISSIQLEINEKNAEAEKEMLAMGRINELTEIVSRINTEVNTINTLVKEKQINIGALKQKSEHISKLKKEITVLQVSQAEYAKETVDYDVLKAAFSQKGIPRQIIGTIIPQLTEISNTILGQMTGGKMGVEFRMVKQSKSGKEKESLDIFIEEYGKPALPYLSKSGGEKVKSSLSIILALAEIKSSSAGIQLGMLFIDEPPFLDADGVDAYCDALETIQGRYKNIKIMAITHDLSMKARFPQNIDVVKTEHGSKVIY